MPKEASCIGCSCTDSHACMDFFMDQACHWLRVDRAAGVGVCSSCPEMVKSWDAGARSKRVAEHVTKEGIEVKPGQIWRDLDKRMHNRQCKVVTVAHGKAVMQSIHSATVPATKVSIRRMHNGSTGWALVSKA